MTVFAALIDTSEPSWPLGREQLAASVPQSCCKEGACHSYAMAESAAEKSQFGDQTGRIGTDSIVLAG